MATKKKPLSLPQRLRLLADEMDALADPAPEPTPEEAFATSVEQARQPGSFKKLLMARRRRKAQEASEGEDTGGEGAPPPAAPPQPRKRRRSGP